MIQRYKSSLPASLALLTIVVVWLLCVVIQWYLLAPQLDSTALLVGFVSHVLALIATLGLSDRIAIQLLLITPRQRSLLLLLQALFLVPLTAFFTLDWSIWALPYCSFRYTCRCFATIVLTGSRRSPSQDL